MACQQIYKTLQEELTAKERQEEDMKKRINLAENELQITKTLLTQTKEEVVTLKNERYSPQQFLPKIPYLTQCSIYI